MTTHIWSAIVDWFSSAPMCAYYGKPWLTSSHLGGNLMVFMAYMAIPIALAKVVRIKGIPFGGLGVMFALFIFLCGIGHGLAILSMWTTSEVYDWIEVSNDILTGLVSLVTAAYIFRLIPVIAQASTPAETKVMKAVIDKYRDEVSVRELGKPWPKSSN